MENHYMLTTGNKKSVPPPCSRAVKKLQEVPENWTLLHDNALAQLLSTDIPGYNSKLGCLKTYVDSLEVSSGMVSVISTVFCSVHQLADLRGCLVDCLYGMMLSSVLIVNSKARSQINWRKYVG